MATAPYRVDRDSLYSIVASMPRSTLEELLNGLLAAARLLGYAARTSDCVAVEQIVIVAVIKEAPDKDQPDCPERPYCPMARGPAGCQDECLLY